MLLKEHAPHTELHKTTRFGGFCFFPIHGFIFEQEDWVFYPSGKELYMPMTILPGWDSLESTANWYWGFHIAGLVFIFLLALSETLAFIYSGRADTLRGIADSARAEKQQREIDEAKAFHAAQVEELKKRAGQVERRIGTFQRQATDRQLSPAQGNALIQALSQFGGQKITVVCIANDPEGCRFAEAFKSVFVASGWHCEGVKQVAYSGGHPVGIEATVNQAEAQAGRIPRAADRLLRALIILGLSGQEIFVHPAVPAGQIEFRVGRPPTETDSKKKQGLTAVQ
jgi:hypothetical protein